MTTDLENQNMLIGEFKEIEKLSLKDITPEEKQKTWGLFGKDDPMVNCRDEFAKAYGKEHFRIFEGEHRLNDTVVKRDLLPLIKELLSL